MDRKPLYTGLLIFLLLGLILFLGVYTMTRLVEEGGLGEDKIALIRIEGPILDARDTIEEIIRYKESPAIKGIVLRIDSPGGAVVPSQEIYEEVRKVRDEFHKKIVVSMGTVAASGGYYIASASDHIVANPGTLTGSIGVIMELANMTGLMEKIGVESVVIKSGRHKDMISPLRPMKEENRKILQKVLDDVHAQFITAVSEGRGLNLDQVQELADGRIFTGREAQTLGLVDTLGNLQDTIQITAEMAGIEGKPRVVETRKPFSFFDYLQNLWDGSLGQTFKPSLQVISLEYLLSF